MTKLLTQKGFLGTHAPFLSDLTLILILTTAILFTIGWWKARNKQFDAHHWIQTTTAGFNTIIVLSVMVRSFIIHILPGIPAKLSQGDYAVTTTHAIIGTMGLLLGLYVVLSTNKLLPKRVRFSNFKPVMITSYSLYMLATLLGLVVYFEVYILGI